MDCIHTHSDEFLNNATNPSLKHSFSSENLQRFSGTEATVVLSAPGTSEPHTVTEEVSDSPSIGCLSSYSATIQREANASKPTSTSRNRSSLDDLNNYPSKVLSSSFPSPIPKRPIYHSFGLVNAIVTIGGIILSLAVLGFLVFLWAGRGKNPEGQLSNNPWRSIMLSGRLVQLITISALVLRVSLSSQVAICTSCVAALILERRSIPLSQSVPLSVLRSVNSGPHILIDHIFRKRDLARLLYPEVILLLLVALGNIAIQFSSTILLSDLHEHSLVEFPKEIQANLSINKNGPAIVIQWMPPPGDTPLFGEISSGYAANPNSLGLSDTGLKQHIMLPFDKGRTAIRSYEGPAMVMGSRVSCIPPVVSGEIRSTALDAGPQLFGYMDGRILVEDSMTRAGLAAQRPCNSTQCPSEISFHCIIPSTVSDEIATAYYIPSRHAWHPTPGSPWTPEAVTVLVLTTNLNSKGWESLGNSTIKLNQHNIKEEWVSYDFGNDRVINVTLCSFATSIMVSNVSMETSKELVEPSLGYLLNPSDTTNIRKLLGADPLVQGWNERGILEVKNITDLNNRYANPLPSLQQTAEYIEIYLKYYSANQTFAGCDTCDGEFANSAREFSRVFQDIIQCTWRASVAVQTIFTMSAQSLHDQHLKFNTISVPVQVRQTVSATIPIRYSGLIAVTALVLTNIICVLAITILYLSYSRYAMIGNFWHAVSQTVSDLTSDILSHGNQANDLAVSDLLKENDAPVRLVKSLDTGHIKIARAERIPDPSLNSEKPTSTIQRMWAKMKRRRRKIV
ncbi:hypothetical protein GGR51DRAFT_572141 [Nemania sp. FL0031]|nr:hypothetical protein GGR51DRAFT_572141 [Nemania sp. FL0031]